MLDKTGKIKLSDAQKSVLPKASSGEQCMPRNFVQLVNLQGTHLHFIVYLIVRQMKYVMEL